jgi:hypothetical protein
MSLEIRTPAIAYRELKTILISEPLIHHPDDKLPYALITDACQGDAVKPGGYGAILAQVRPDGQFHVIGYANRLKDQEKHLAPFLLEMSASVWEMEHFTHFLRGRHFALYTDHKPLVNLGVIYTKALSQIQEAVLKYDFEIIYQKGNEMQCSNTILRSFTRKEMKCLGQNVGRQLRQKQNTSTWLLCQTRKPRPSPTPSFLIGSVVLEFQ